MTITDRLSPNFNERRAGAPTDFLILHYTGMKSAEDAFRRLCDPASEVSAHYLVDEDGAVYRLVDEANRAWHAGKGYWAGETDMNSRSIGIEIVNPGHEHGYRPFPSAQMKAVSELCRDIFARHNIPAHNVLAHSDYAPARKEDPGELFGWKDLARQGVGVWPDVQAQDRAGLIDEAAFRTALDRYGYDPQADLKRVITAFQRHFHPEAFKEPQRIGSPDPESLARLRGLLRMKGL